GCTTVGVRTGHGLRKSKVQPDYIFENLKEAVDFILDEPYRETFEDISKRVNNSGSTFVISIGGQSRSGKSILGTYLLKKFEEFGKTVLKIELDHWIKPREMRKVGDNVFDNFQMEKLENDLENFFSGKSITAPGYQTHKTWPLNTVTYNPGKFDVLIVEGVVALSSKVLCKKSDLRVFKGISKVELKKRFYSFYTWKDYDEAQIEKLWVQRKTSEFDLIADDIKQADLVI
ncbi:MAG: hypothetical protein ACPF9D_07275, partial [Owenweeksia sp.]